MHPYTLLLEKARATTLERWARSGDDPTVGELAVLAYADPESIFLRDARIQERRRHGKPLDAVSDVWAYRGEG